MALDRANGPVEVQRFDIAFVFALDLSNLLRVDSDNSRKFQEGRARGTLSNALREALTQNIATLGQWSTEAARISERMNRAEAAGGKKVWARQFMDRYSPLLLNNGNYTDLHLPDGTRIGRDSEFRDAGNVFKSGRYGGAAYRIAPEGMLSATYQAKFEAPDYTVGEVIKILAEFRGAAFGTFQSFLADYFTVERRAVLEAACKIDLEDPSVLDDENIRGATEFHSVVFIEGFSQRAPTGPQVLPIDQVVDSFELAGILNEANWFESYDPRYCKEVASKQIGYRKDEIYVTDRRSTVIVSPKFWQDDPLKFYRWDLLLAVEHHLMRLAFLKQQSSFYRNDASVRPLESKDPIEALPLVLAGRENLTLVHESLDFGVLVRHGFTRKFALSLRDEMDFPEALAVIEKRIADMSEAINLKSSITAAEEAARAATASISIAAQTNRLQWSAVTIAVVALIVAIAGIFSPQIQGFFEGQSGVVPSVEQPANPELDGPQTGN